MKFNIPDRHLTASNILMALTLFAVAGGTIGVILQQVLMLVIAVAVLAAFSLGIYAIWQVVRQSGGILVSYDEPDCTVRHVHTVRHIHVIEHVSQQRLIDQQPTRYAVVAQPQQSMALPVVRKRLEVREF